MPISIERCVLEPSVAKIAETVFMLGGLDEATEQMGAEVAAEKPGTPLNEMFARVASGTHGGNGDDLAEFAGRQCYRSWNQGRKPEEYIANTIADGHGSIFEHSSVVFQLSGVSRSFTHELIRHRVGTAVSQESQRYVDAKDIRFVVPPLMAEHLLAMTPAQQELDEEFTIFRVSCNHSLNAYQQLQAKFNARLASADTTKAKTEIRKRATEAARSLLPNAAETRLVFTTNLRALRHIVTLRGTEFADLEIKRVVIAMLRAAVEYAPHFLKDLEIAQGKEAMEIVRAQIGRV